MGLSRSRRSIPKWRATRSLVRRITSSQAVAAQGAEEIDPVEVSIAGPEGGTVEKPVGLVHMAAAGTGRPTHHDAVVYPGGRDAIRDATVVGAFAMIRTLLRSGA